MARRKHGATRQSLASPVVPFGSRLRCKVASPKNGWPYANMVTGQPKIQEPETLNPKALSVNSMVVGLGFGV